MIGLWLLPVVLSLIVLGAHFLRAGNVVMVVVVLLLLGLLVVRRGWAFRTVRLALLLAVLEWVRTLALLVSSRTQHGQPVLRLAVILGTVALLTGLSSLVFRSSRVRAWYESGPADVEA